MPIQEYIHQINEKYRSGFSKEHGYRGTFENLCRTLMPGRAIINEPGKVKDCGNPDFVVSKGRIPVGYIEVKDIGSDLDAKLYKEQFSRYRNALDNLIISDYLLFRFYQNADLVHEVRIGEIQDGRVVPLSKNFAHFARLMGDFSTFIGISIKSASTLAKMMAAKARLLQHILENALTSDEKSAENSELKGQLNAFREVLIHDITPKEFADIYAQTLAYGMFAARLHDPTLEDFSREEAATLIPRTNPFLRKLFQYIAGYDIDPRIKTTVENLVDVFRAADVRAIMDNFGKTTQQNDPVIHFYETFLAAYDPKLRKSRGVWYTPEPVVNFIVRAVDDILKTEFGLAQGLADTEKTTIELDSQVADGRSKTGYKRYKKEVHKVQILDPAAGTGTFLAEIVKHIYNTRFKAMQGIWSSYVENDLIPRLNGFELLMASYAMAHLKLDLLLTETGYKPQKPKRFQVYLTNSLEEHHPDTGTLFTAWLSDESNEANHIKRDTPVMVVIGNPPYSGHSANKGKWIEELLKDYKQEPGGGKLQEKNPKWLNDDYVKFIRYGQYYVEKNGEGVLAFINNHGFLDNPTFRGMRWHLLSAFDKIYVLDLHGNSKKKEACPDGSPDKNVFDIQQGVSINLFVKTGKKKKNELGKVFHFDLYGVRESKYDFLRNHDVKGVAFEPLPLIAPQYYFVQKNLDVQKSYDEGFSINQLFTVNSVGIVTARDSFTIHETADAVKETIQEFLSLDDETARSRFNLGKDVRDWKVRYAKEDLKKSGPDFSRLTRICYRPFDVRFTYYTGRSRGFHCMPRGEVMRHFLNRDNIGICSNRTIEQNRWFTDIFVFNLIIQHHSLSIKEVNNIAPLYLYPENSDQQTLENEDHQQERTPNLNSEIVDKIADNLHLRFTPEKEEETDTFAPIDLLDYIYAILHSPAYREKYKEFLKIDFPRIPYPTDPETFWKLVKMGGELRQIHLLESPKVEQFITAYPKDGGNQVTRKITKKDWELYDEEKELGRIRINDNQYFEGIPLTAWEFYIGGYQPAQKWLKDRSGRTLTFEDILHYQKIIVALAETDRIMKEIDGVYAVD